MLKIVLRKMLKTRFMVLCLLTGVITATAMMSSIPQYTGGILQKVLTKDLENYQVKNNIFPGSYYVKKDFFIYNPDVRKSRYDEFNGIVSGNFYNSLGVPMLSNVKILTFDYFFTEFFSTYNNEKIRKDVTLQAMSDKDKHVTMLHGRYPSSKKADGIYEVMLSEAAINDLDLKLNSVYTLENNVPKNFKPIDVKVVGVFAPKDKNDLYWYNGEVTFNWFLFMDYSLFISDFMNPDNCLMTNASWYAAFDYHKITLENISSITSSLGEQYEWLDENPSTDFNITALDILKKYDGRQKQLKLILWALQVPVILMLVFYLFMVAQLIIEEEKNEIVVLKSRGASRGQIIRGYLIESLIISGMALILGPLLGISICRLLGASNGFLEFVQRTKLPVYLDSSGYIYSLIAIGLFTATMLIPAYFASNSTIVIYKQKYSGNTAFWKRYFLDFLLIIVSCYGIYSYGLRQRIMDFNTGDAANLPIDPLLFLISTFFILGLGLFFVRIFPYIIKLLFRAGRRIWSPAAYTSLLYISRSGSMDQFLIIFLVFTLSTGVFSANSARSINTSSEEKIRYSIGADVTLMPIWDATAGIAPGAPSSSYSSIQKSKNVSYAEPDFDQFEKLSGAESATKVYRRNDGYINVGTKSLKQVYVIGINPPSFGRAAWFRHGLLSHHWFEYLNVMAKDPMAVLLSRSFQEKYNVKLGDEINVTLGDSGSITGIVYAFIDYWPTYNPRQLNGQNLQQDLVVANLDYIQQLLPLEPYEVWIKMKSGASSQQLYDDIKNKGLQIEYLNDTKQEIIKSRNDPILQGINGALTLSFIVTMAIATAGFLIHLIMSVRSRILQFAVLRAMGLTYMELIRMLMGEQILISAAAIFTGIIIGGIASHIFVPMLQIAFNASDQVLPFRVVTYSGDYNKIYAAAGIMLLTGLAVLSAILSMIKIDQALKLGED